MSQNSVEIVVTLYTNPGCHLCDAVADTIAAAGKVRPFKFLTRDILQDPADHERYKHAIPVVTVNGREVSRYRLALHDLLTALDAAKSHSAAANG